MAQQRREHSRVRFGGRVSCIPTADVEEQFCQGCNISQGGALLRTVAGPRPAMGSMVELRLEAEELGPLPAIDGEVVRHDGDELFAVRFVNLDAPRRAIIRRVMAAGSDDPSDAEAAPEEQAGAYSVASRSSRKITQIYGERELSDLKQASRRAADERRGQSRDLADGDYSSIEDAVRGASAEQAVVGQGTGEAAKVPVMAVPVMAVSLDAVAWHRLDPLVAVILSKVDGRATFGEILAAVEIDRSRAWELITLLMQQGIIRERG